jgi:hypothetical protein
VVPTTECAEYLNAVVVVGSKVVDLQGLDGETPCAAVQQRSAPVSVALEHLPPQ